jgi:hypothetical protein
MKDGKFLPMHYVLQLPSGNWIGKLGAEGPTIITKDLKNLTECYGQIIFVYSRPNGAYSK